MATSRRKLELVAFVSSAAVALVLFVAVGAAGAAGQPRAAIVLASDLTPWSFGEVYRLDVDGRRVNLSRSVADDTNPLVSPDGKRVAYVSDRGMVDGNVRVFVVGRDGSDLRPVSTAIDGRQFDLGWVGNALSWSPDSRRLVLGAVDEHGSRLFVLEPGKPARLIHRRPVGMYDPVWSADGALIGFWSSPSHDRGIEVMTPSGQPVARPGSIAWLPPQETLRDPWSPGGRLQATRDGNGVQIRRPDGTKVRTLVGQVSCSNPRTLGLAWFPDGRSLVYDFVCLENDHDLFTVELDGTGARRLTDTAQDEEDPEWSPDGGRIAYASTPRVRGDCHGCPTTIWIRDADGTHPRPVTRNPSSTYDRCPSWSPDGATIAFSRSSAAAPAGLFVVPSRGGAVRSLGLEGGCPHWGPGGIVYEGDSDDLWQVSPDGSGNRKLADGTSPAVSRSGTLAYLFEVGDRQREVVLANADGKTIRRLELPLRDIGSVGWSRDGESLLLAAFVAHRMNLYSVRADGTGLRRLTLTGF